MRADRHETLDQATVLAEVIDRRPILVRHPERAVVRNGDTLEVAAERIERQHLVAQVDRDFIVVRLVRVGRQRSVRQAGQPAAVVGAQRDLLGEIEAAVPRIQREAHEARVEERQQERAIDADRLGVRAAVGVRDELELAVDRDAFERSPENPPSRSFCPAAVVPTDGRSFHS